MTNNHAELCECDCLNYCGDDPDLSKRTARPCRNAIDWAHEQALEIEAERERQRKVDLFESQAARIQQQALEYVSLQAQCDEHLARVFQLEILLDSERSTNKALSDENALLADHQPQELLERIAELEADRDSWRDQASQRLADWDEMRKERDALKADVERWREFAEHQTWCADCGESVSTCPIGSRLQKAALQAEKETRS